MDDHLPDSQRSSSRLLGSLLVIAAAVAAGRLNVAGANQLVVHWLPIVVEIGWDVMMDTRFIVRLFKRSCSIDLSSHWGRKQATITDCMGCFNVFLTVILFAMKTVYKLPL